MTTSHPNGSVSAPIGHAEPIVVVASPNRAVELLRWATLRSDDVRFVSPRIDAAARGFATRYAVEVRDRGLRDADLDDASALLLGLDDADAENAVIRRARRRGIAVHVRGRPLVSDFTILGMMEQPRLGTTGGPEGGRSAGASTVP